MRQKIILKPFSLVSYENVQLPTYQGHNRDESQINTQKAENYKWC